MLFTTVLYQLISLMLIAAVGVLLTKIGIISEQLTTGMGNIMTKACLPCLLIASMQMEFDRVLLGKITLAAGGFMIVMCISALLIALFALLKKANIRDVGVYIVCSSFPNVVYVGRPLIEAVYGIEATPYLTVIALVFTITVFSIGILLISIGNKKKMGGIKVLLSKSFINPAVIGGAIGILLFVLRIRIPAQILTPMQMMSSMVTPLSMLIIGSTLARAKIKDIIGDFAAYAVTFVRLILTPVLVFFLFSLFIHDKVLLGTLVISSCLPVGANAGVIAHLYDNNPIFAAKCIFMSTILCLLTTPLIVLLFL